MTCLSPVPEESFVWAFHVDAGLFRTSSLDRVCAYFVSVLTKAEFGGTREQRSAGLRTEAALRISVACEVQF